MTFRKLWLCSLSAFICYLLWLGLTMDTPNSVSVLWPGIVALVSLQLIPMERMEGTLFVRLIEAWKGGDDRS